MFFVVCKKKKETENKCERIQVQWNIDCVAIKCGVSIAKKGNEYKWSEKNWTTTISLYCEFDIQICISLEVRLYRFVLLWLSHKWRSRREIRGAIPVVRGVSGRGLSSKLVFALL